MGRRFALAAIALSLVGSSTGVAADRAETQTPSCNATPLRFEWNKRAGGFPWIAVGPKRSRLEAWLVSYEAYVADARVNQSDGMVVRAGVEEKIGWFSRALGGARLRVGGRRLDGGGTFAQTFRADHGSRWYPSGLRVPTPGCWELTVRTNAWRHRVVVQAIEPPADGVCDATPGNTDGSILLTPRRSRLAAGLGWRTPEGGALLYTGGRTPDGGNTKVLWRATGDVNSAPSGRLVLRGTQLDGTATLSQTHSEVSPRAHWPSIVVVPTPGCWLLTARVGGVGGILVVRVIDP